MRPTTSTPDEVPAKWRPEGSRSRGLASTVNHHGPGVVLARGSIKSLATCHRSRLHRDEPEREAGEPEDNDDATPVPAEPAQAERAATAVVSAMTGPEPHDRTGGGTFTA